MRSNRTEAGKSPGSAQGVEWEDVIGDYNNIRPHSALGNLPPAAYSKLTEPPKV